MPHIWWIRRDLRLYDNPALDQALQPDAEVLPVFVLDPALLNSPYVGAKRLAFLYAGLQEVDRDLQARGGRLLCLRGEPMTVLRDLCERFPGARVYTQEDFSPYARARDERVAQAVDLTLTPGVTAMHPGAVLKSDGDPYTVFTPFSRTWKAQYAQPRLHQTPDHIPVPEGFEGEPLPSFKDLEALQAFPPGEAEAQRRLQTFTQGPDAPVYGYGAGRNQVDRSDTSGLSPYLRFGMLSPRQAVAAAYQAMEAAADQSERKSAETWLNELIWREFFIAILYHFPGVRTAAFREMYRDIPWENNEEQFAAWCAGKTGYPLVDAAMRQLTGIGWMHNRARMVTASFLTKDLLIDWRWGERWFMEHLVDGDPASNNGGWQWTAGVGTDAAPYFRIFNPISQSRKHDPNGVYIRRWLPELRDVPAEYIHEPWTMPAAAQESSGCRIGEDYPEPIVDHAWARDRTLVAYKQVRPE